MTRKATRIVCILGAAATLLIAASARAGDPPNPPPVDEARQARLEQLQSRGKEASIAVFPVVLGGTPKNEARDAVAMFLERGGMTHVSGADQVFQPAAGQSLDDIAGAFGTAVREAKVQADYALFAEFIGAPQRGVDEVRAVIVDNQGNLVWQDRQTPDDADFKRIKPSDPMTCCVLLMERMRPVMGLSDPFREEAAAGDYQKKWADATGLPAGEERDAMRVRLETFRAAASEAPLEILPVRVNDKLSAERAVVLAELLKSRRFAGARSGEATIEFALEPTMNEQKTLWSMARAVREHVRANPPRSEYVLFAHYLVAPDEAQAVHFVVCDRSGEWVIVDFQNSHWEDFARISPKSENDCDQLVATRLEGYLK
jgi:hypothetical protein